VEAECGMSPAKRDARRRQGATRGGGRVRRSAVRREAEAGRDARWRHGAPLAEVRLRPGGAGRGVNGGEVEARVWSSGGEAREEEG
jgi:hypothetical protein